MDHNLALASLFALILFSSYSKAEVYSSIDQLSQVGDFVGRIGSIIDKSIALEEQKLLRLKQLQEEFSHETSVSFQNQSVVVQQKHPIGIFLFLDRFLDKIKTLDIFVDDVKESTQEFELINELEKLKANETFPSTLDLNGAAKGIARLQAFYDLDIDRIVEGRIQLAGNYNSFEPKMDATSCFKLGRILYHEDDKNLKSMSWFMKAIDLFQRDQGIDLSHVLDSKLISNFDTNSLLNLDEETKTKLADMLEYLAFASYLHGKLRYALEVTRIWLTLTPDNPRAIENFDWYQDQLRDKPDQDAIEENDSTSNNVVVQSEDRTNYRVSSNNYEVSDDHVTKQLCRGQVQNHRNDGKCYVIQLEKHQFLAGLKVEVVRSEPKIVRFYDVITEDEAAQIRLQALTKLKRSGLHGRNGSHVSDYRIAKTAWLAGDPVVSTVERRLGTILGLYTTETEALQVVNYGLGGYYGPHLDALKGVELNATKFKSDRLLTALIYLNHIEIGGSTIFPRLGVEVEPIARSAVVWFNKLRNGTNDQLVMHTACPVLLGSKWIATKWFRDLPNLFLRPCGIDRMKN